MFSFSQIIVLFAVVSLTKGDDCQTCVNESNIWCVESSKCSPALLGYSLLSISCNTTINNILNCPKYPESGCEYTDDFGRTFGLPYIGAVYAETSSECIKYNTASIENHFPSATVYSNIIVDCTEKRPDFPCHAYIVVDPTNKVIAVTFEGTAGGPPQLKEEDLSFFVPKKPFFNNGYLYDYWFTSFMSLWKGGLQNDTNHLHALYPNYNLWVFGHSLGASQATIYASYLIKTGLYTPEKVRLLTFGQPRTGDKEFAKWHDETFLYSYRVVHKNDVVPHLPPSYGIDELWHHRYEVWYDNNMTVGEPYSICPESDGNYCSNKYATDLNWNDHVVYFVVNLNDYASKGCL